MKKKSLLTSIFVVIGGNAGGGADSRLPYFFRER